MKASRITKIAGLGLAGFVAASFVADKANLTPLLAQVAGFAGAVVGSVVGRGRKQLEGRRGEATRKKEQPS